MSDPRGGPIPAPASDSTKGPSPSAWVRSPA
eukprot:CAMPEP_0195121840 /NCGR_PEP_ID=MMETSP0448-20130528/125146_1 /TAXON_ID=66468 /ORGANISM="Heterocapsa triquestra, Strain CCMP 448" /LENGTH=30 /DNA_ID= /DNA_START= /DNA_END= /DNA_ORIENTATION=